MKYSAENIKRNTNKGVDMEGKVFENMMKTSLIEPIIVKKGAIQSVYEAA